MARLSNPQRRFLLKCLTGASAATLMPLQAVRAAQQAMDKALHWENWSGSQEASPQHIVYPGSEEALRKILLQSDEQIRCVGGSHSFSPLVPCEGTLISLAQMIGLKQHNNETNTATLAAGTRLATASQMLFNVGQSFVNQPDVNTQTLAGAISTATHGTGVTLPSLSACVNGLRLMTADGEVHVIDESTPDLLNAAAVSLGALGIITEISFKNMPAYHLEEKTHVVSMREAMDIVERDKDKHRHIEFFGFPYGDTAILKTLDITDKPDTTAPVEGTNDALRMACEVTMHAGWLTPMVQSLLGMFVSEETKRGPAWDIFATPRTVAFNEMEYTVPADKGLEVVEEVAAAMCKSDVYSMFPIEYRYVAEDSNWMSQFYQRAGASISIHQYAKQDYKPLFNLVEPILKRHAGRPHWGKLNSLTHAEAMERYPRFGDFIKLQKELDPKGRMLNDYMRKLLGAA